MRIRQQIEEELVIEFAKKGLVAQITEGLSTQAIEIIAKPFLGAYATPYRYTVPHWKTRYPSWHDCWWARLLRWVNERVFRCTATSKSPFPGWLTDLLYTYEVDLCAKVETLPLDVLERIQVMRNYLAFHRWGEPTKVIMGRRAFFELRGACIRHHPDALTFSQDPGGSVRIFNLTIQVNPFLAEDAVLVC